MLARIAPYFPFLLRLGVTIPIVRLMMKMQLAESSDVTLGLLGLGYSVVLGVIWVGPVLEKIAGSGSRLYVPGDHKFDHTPEYSIGQAREKEGRIAEAIEVYREYKVKYKKEVEPHLKIAELQTKHFRDVTSALVELKEALPKARDHATYVMIHYRMADFYLEFRKDRSAALDCLKHVQKKFPGTKFAKDAAQRAKRLLDSSASSMQEARD